MADVTTRLVYHNARTNKKNKKVFSAKHNDRNFPDNEGRYDESKNTIKYYQRITTEHCETIEDYELAYYREHFSADLDEQNEKHIKSRHKEKVKTMAQYKKLRTQCPEETIYQIGGCDFTKKTGYKPSAKKLWECYAEYVKWHQATYPQCKILNAALHLDEAYPHIHERHIWVYYDEDGREHIGQDKALKQMGVKSPHPDKTEHKYNNPKQTYTKACREKMCELAEQYFGYTIIREPKTASKEQQDLADWQLEQDRQNHQELVKRNNDLSDKIDAENERFEQWQAGIEVARQNADEELAVYKKSKKSKIDATAEKYAAEQKAKADAEAKKIRDKANADAAAQQELTAQLNREYVQRKQQYEDDYEYLQGRQNALYNDNMQLFDQRKAQRAEIAAADKKIKRADMYYEYTQCEHMDFTEFCQRLDAAEGSKLAKRNNISQRSQQQSQSQYDRGFGDD